YTALRCYGGFQDHGGYKEISCDEDYCMKGFIGGLYAKGCPAKDKCKAEGCFKLPLSSMCCCKGDLCND
ncbi:hypothetical protein PENTCL1PPCAC_5122, partial [Pristionchus entomophagus]